MKILCTVCALICVMQLRAQLNSIPGNLNRNTKNNLSISLDAWREVGLNYQRRIIQKGKFSLWGEIGVSSVIPSSFEPQANTSYTIGYVIAKKAIGFYANIGTNIRWNINEVHSFEFGAFLRRYQFVEKDLANDYNAYTPISYFKSLSANLSLGYRFQPKGKNWNLSLKYIQSVKGTEVLPAPLKLGFGYNF